MENDYGFILDQDNNTRRKVLPKKNRIIVVIIGALLLVLAIAIFFAVMFGGEKSEQEKLYPVAGAQADILKISDIGQQKIRDNASVRQASTINLVFSSQSNALSKYVGQKSSKQYAVYQDSDYEKIFEDAEKTGSLDAKYATVMKDRLDEYKQILVTAYSQTNDPAVKKLLESFNSQLSIILGEQTSPKDD